MRSKLHRCTCTWADEGDRESGPSPYIERLDPTCPDPEHRAAFEEDAKRAEGYAAIEERADHGR